MTCIIEIANYENGFWVVRAAVVSLNGVWSGIHHIEGDIDMTDQAIHAAVLALYA